MHTPRVCQAEVSDFELVGSEGTQLRALGGGRSVLQRQQRVGHEQDVLNLEVPGER